MKKATLKLEERQHLLRNYFLTLAPETDLDELNELISQFEMDDFPKNHFVLRAGDLSQTVNFICKGLARIYYIKESREINHWIMTENMMLAPAYTIFTGNTNIMNFKTLEPTCVLKIKYSVLESYYYKYQSLGYLGRKLVEYYYAGFMKKTFNVLFLSADERYLLFLKEHDGLINRVPLKFIASHLGLTQETISRLRAKHS